MRCERVDSPLNPSNLQTKAVGVLQIVRERKLCGVYIEGEDDVETEAGEKKIGNHVLVSDHDQPDKKTANAEPSNEELALKYIKRLRSGNCNKKGGDNDDEVRGEQTRQVDREGSTDNAELALRYIARLRNQGRLDAGYGETASLVRRRVETDGVQSLSSLGDGNTGMTRGGVKFSLRHADYHRE